MSNLLISFRSLAKKHNGMFVSEKQSKFLLSQCDSRGIFQMTAHASFGFGDDGVVNQYYNVVVRCDNLGVVEIAHVSDKTGKSKIVFARADADVYAAKLAAKQAEQKEYDDRRAKKVSFHKKRINKLTNVLEKLKNIENPTMRQEVRIYIYEKLILKSIDNVRCFSN